MQVLSDKKPTGQSHDNANDLFIELYNNPSQYGPNLVNTTVSWKALKPYI